MFVSGAVALPITGVPGAFPLALALASAGVHILYDLALMNAYRLGSFNQMYPIARGTSPLVVTLGAMVFVHEVPGALSLAGIVVLAFGLGSLAVSGRRIPRGDLPALGAAVLTGLLIAAFTLIDGVGVRHAADPFSYMAMLFLFQGPVFVVVALIRRERSELVAGGIAQRGVLAGALVVIAYSTVMWSQTRAPLADVAALRETGVISAAIIGAVFFKEGFGIRRVLAAVVVALGIALIAL